MEWSGPASLAIALINLIGIGLSILKVGRVYTLSVKTEEQTNNRLSVLDEKLRNQAVIIKEHEAHCQDSKLKIADLTLRLAEAVNRITEQAVKSPGK